MSLMSITSVSHFKPEKAVLWMDHRTFHGDEFNRGDITVTQMIIQIIIIVPKPRLVKKIQWVGNF